MTSSDDAKTPPRQQWAKPLFAFAGIVAVCGTGIYLVEKSGGTEMVRAMGPALVAVVSIAR